MEEGEMREAVNFLSQVYQGSIQDVATIKVAEAENDKETVEKYLVSVRDYVDKLIKGLEK